MTGLLILMMVMPLDGGFTTSCSSISIPRSRRRVVSTDSFPCARDSMCFAIWIDTLIVVLPFGIPLLPLADFRVMDKHSLPVTPWKSRTSCNNIGGLTPVVDLGYNWVS